MKRVNPKDKTRLTQRANSSKAQVVSASPDVLCAKRASWMTASLGWTTVVVLVEAGAEVVSSSRGTGEPSRDRLSGVWTPLE